MTHSASSQPLGGLVCPRAPGAGAHTAASPRAGDSRQSLAGIIARVIHTLDRWRQRARQRRHLLRLDDRLLADVGISRADAYREARKPFWRK